MNLQQKKRPETELSNARDDFLYYFFELILIYFLSKLEYEFGKPNSTIRKQNIY